MAEPSDFRAMLRAGECSQIACGNPKICICALAEEMADEIGRLRELAYAPDGSEMRSALFKEAEWRGRLYDALRRIDALNDHPSHYNPDIQRVLDAALTGKP